MPVFLTEAELDKLTKKMKEDKLPAFYQDIFIRALTNLDKRIEELEEILKNN
jgi:hypothetical protein